MFKNTKAKACLIEKKCRTSDTCKPIIVNDPYLP